MSSSERSATKPFPFPARLALAAGLVSAFALGGCSADLARFDMANASFNSDQPRGRSVPMPAESLRRNAGAPMEPAYERPSEPAPYMPPPASAPVRQSGLPEPVMREPEARRLIDVPRRDGIGQPRPQSAPLAPQAPVPRDGPVIEVQQGDTVYGLAKRHRVSISELMAANNLQKPMIKPGQKLVLPGAKRAVPARKTEHIADAGPASQATPRFAAPGVRPPAAVPAPSAPADVSSWNGTHTVSPRDSLSSIARRYGVRVADLQTANGIADPTKMRAGTVLKVPTGSGASATASPPVPSEVPARLDNAPLAGSPTIINANRPERVAAVTPQNPIANDATPTATPVAAPAPPPKAPAVQTRPQSAVAGPMKFRWPVKGRVIANFGPRNDSSHNDGINILVPQGTEVMAAEGGTVAYAGSELKGYGNLVLIRHEGNWVSAYAHNETLLVKRGDKIERGQVIAKAGKTGAVDQPQVHFELRQGSKPVDPLPHLEK